MHELSVSQAIADVVLKEAAKHGATKVLAVELQIGDLSLLNADQVEFCLTLVLENTPAAGAELRVTRVEPEIRCEVCSYVGPLVPDDHMRDDPMFHFLTPAFKCPYCGSGDIKVLRGRECTVTNIEIQT